MTRHVQVSADGVDDFGYHVVWWPKCRRPVFDGRAAGGCEELIGAEAAGSRWPMVALQIMADHVHLLVTAHRCDCPSSVVGQLEVFTSRYLRAEFAHLRSRLPTLWSGSRLAATASAVTAQAMHRYTGTRDGRPSRKERAR